MTKIKSSKGQTAAWVLLVGAWGALVSALMGTIACLTIVGIPVGIKHFKFIKLLFTTDDVAVAYRPDFSHRAHGLYWYIFGGIFTRILCSIMPAFLNLIGAAQSIVIRFEKISPYLACPFNVEIVENGNYSKAGDTVYDYKLLQRRIYKSPTVAIFDEQRNKLVTVRRYIKGFENDVFSIKRSTQIVLFLFVGLIIFGTASLIGGVGNIINGELSGFGDWWGIIVGAFLFAVGIIGSSISKAIQTTQLLKIHDAQMKKLFDLFDETDPYDATPVKISLVYVFDRLFRDREERKREQNTRKRY